ncbi:hypothetical protein [Prosthecobacter vanneervenii]|uniref:Uncharacterized protein n=1 Tax=Prosthecobacter vanneervenii TaxID=48466 RepID=A0A7W8DM31_9BACT|nr:hypothetical protein [Prosthecobacter vanneervenii]MBB5034655.1 hypothetical protein [Prosthecobacter vanneervenii]
MGKLILGAVLAALAVFSWEALSWTVIGWHTNGFRSFRDESAVAEVIKANVTAGHGTYLLPSMGQAPKVATAEEKKAFEAAQAKALADGPYMYAVVRPGKTEISMGTNMVLSFIRTLVCAFLIAALLSQVALFYPARIAYVAAAGLFAGLVADLPMWIWFENPGRDTVVNIADHVIAWVIGGAVLGIFVGRDPVAEP